MDRHNNEKLENLRNSCKCVDLENVNRRHDLLDEFVASIEAWPGLLPIDLRDFFRPEQIECLLSESIDYWAERQNYYLIERLVSFVARGGYRDDLEADVEARRTTPVHLVSKRRLCNGDVVAYWLFKIYPRFDVNYSDEDGLTHFHVACEYGFDDVVRKFLELGQDPNCLVPKTGDSGLHLAVAGGHPIVARTLLRHNDTVPNLVNTQGWTPLDLICQKANDSEAAMFLQIFHENSEAYRRESLVNSRDCRGNTKLNLALSSWRRILSETLLRFGADPNVVNSRGETPLHSICKRVNEVLLRAGADPNLTNEVGFTALHSFGEECHCNDMAKLLFRICEEIGRPVRLDVRDASGMSPLHYALLWDREAEIIKLLLKAGASPNYANGRGSTPLQVAVASLMPDVVQVLLDGGADVADFDFPTAGDFDDYYKADRNSSNYAFLRLARTLDCVERLEASGRGSYELDHSGALTIVDFCHERGVFADNMPRTSFWSEEEHELVKILKEDLMKLKDMCLCDLYVAKVEEAAKRVTYADCYEFAEMLLMLPSKYHAMCFRPLCEIISRRFFRHWAVEFFMDLTRCRLPIICCEKIIDDSYDNKDLFTICLAAKG